MNEVVGYVKVRKMSVIHRGNYPESTINRRHFSLVTEYNTNNLDYIPKDHVKRNNLQTTEISIKVLYYVGDFVFNIYDFAKTLLNGHKMFSYKCYIVFNRQTLFVLWVVKLFLGFIF